MLIFLNRKICFEKTRVGSTCISDSAIDLEKSSIFKLPFKFSIVATEIDASLYRHPRIKYRLIPVQVSLPDYSKITPTVILLLSKKFILINIVIFHNFCIT